MIKDGSGKYHWACTFGNTVITYGNIDYNANSNMDKIQIGGSSGYTANSVNYVTVMYDKNSKAYYVFLITIKPIQESTDKHLVNVPIYQPSDNNTKLVRNRKHKVVFAIINSNMSLTKPNDYYFKLGNTYITSP